MEEIKIIKTRYGYDFTRDGEKIGYYHPTDGFKQRPGWIALADLVGMVEAVKNHETLKDKLK